MSSAKDFMAIFVSISVYPAISRKAQAGLHLQ